ncbi:hypothetical protein [Vibrio alginolyticus]
MKLYIYLKRLLLDKATVYQFKLGWLPPYLVEGRWLEEVKAGKITR